MTLQEVPLQESQVEPPRRVSSKVVALRVAGVVVLVLLIAGAFAVHRSQAWQPTAFPNDSGYGSEGTASAVNAGSTYYATITLIDRDASHPGWVTLHGAAPDGLTDSTGATFSYLLCTVPPGAPQPTGIGPAEDMRHYCTSLVAADDTRMALGSQQIWVAITPDHAGSVGFHGLDVHYVQDGHSGSQRVGPIVRIRVK